MSATESAERGEVDPAVELVARRLATTVKRAGLAPIPQLQDALFTALAEDAIDALADRLLPPVVQTREEAGWMIGDLSIVPYTEMVQRMLTMGDRRFVRTISTLADDGSPYGGATVVGKWLNVDE